VPIPPAPRAQPSAAPAPALALDGWARVPNVRRELSRLPACAARRALGTRFLLQRSVADAIVDGHHELAQGVVYDIRVSGREACVAAMAALLSPDRAAPQAGAAPGPGAAAGGPVTFARADFAAQRAEGGERGEGGQGSVRRLGCALQARP
jgi:hypothetical protein